MVTSLAQALRSAGVTRVLAPGDPGYASETSGFDLGVACLPDLVVAAQTPAEVAATVAVAGERGERLTVLGAGHGRLHELSGGVAISVRTLAGVHLERPGARPGSARAPPGSPSSRPLPRMGSPPCAGRRRRSASPGISWAGAWARSPAPTVSAPTISSKSRSSPLPMGA